MKKSIVISVLIPILLNACSSPKTKMYHLSFTNKSDNTVEFSWLYRSTKEGKTEKVKKGGCIDFDFWTDENPQKFFPQTADSIVVVLVNGKKIIEVKKCEALGGTSTCNPDERSFFNPKAYIMYKSGWLNKKTGGKEYIFTNEDAQRAK